MLEIFLPLIFCSYVFGEFSSHVFYATEHLLRGLGFCLDFRVLFVKKKSVTYSVAEILTSI